ncbi:MAG: alkaline phosphatase family protein [Candidatus Methanofastidiosum sp.]|nr:alkaline phosphatase family protein [Methanofastidiosum sp.]
MLVVLAIDALEYALVEKYQCENLKQKYYGKTNISEFSQPRTMVLWSSFMTGENKEKEILKLGDKEMWNKQFDIKETFFFNFQDPKIIDLPGFSYDKKQHEEERELLKAYFATDSPEEKTKIRNDYNAHAFSHHRKIKTEFLEALEGNYDFVLGYFSVADVIGHLNFGNNLMMKMIYKDLDEIAGAIKHNFIVLSDHGMKAIGQFGDHSEYGFWSTSFKDINNPKITDFSKIIVGMM